MEAKARRNAVARAVLIWLDGEGDNHPLVEDFLTLPAACVGDEMVGNDELVRTVRWLDARGLIDGLRIDEVPYPVKLRLTDAGRVVVMEQDGWVEPAAASPASSAAPAAKPSPNVVAQAFLGWLYEHNQQQPIPAKFLDDPRSRIDDHQVDHDEMVEAVELLEAKELVKGAKSWGSSIPMRISLTPAGRIRVVEHDANPSGTGPTRTFDEVAHSVAAVDKSVTITGSGNQIISHSSNTNQSLTDATPPPDFAISYRGRAAGRSHHVEVRMISGPEQLDVSVGVAVLEPQDHFTATVIAGENRRMVRDLTREIIVIVDPPVIDTAVAVELIVTCQDLGESDRRWSLHRSLTIPRPARIHRAQVGRLPRSTEVRRRPR